MKLLKDSGEEVVELYGIWLSDWKKDPLSPEVYREDIALAKILEPTFRFKERGLYRVNCARTCG